jgi:hypothetical protein
VTFYTLALFTHSLLRWVVLALAVIVLVRAFAAWRSGRAWLPTDERLYAALLGSVDLQFLIGLLIYALLSPLSRAFWTETAVAMKDPILRFYGLEHVLGMIIAITVLHIGRARSKKADSDALRHRRAWISVLAALLIMGASIPWPGTPQGRPLLRPLW